MSVDPLANTGVQSGSMLERLRGERVAKLTANASFARMLKMVRPHWRILTLGLVLSLGVAITYATGLAGLYPVLKVLLEEASLRPFLTETAASLRAAGDWRAVFAPLLSGLAPLFPPADAPGAALQSLLIMVGVLVAVNLVGNLLRFVSQYCILYGCNRAMMDVRRYMYRKALHMPMNALSGDVSSMISQFLSDVREVYLGIITLFGKVAREPLKAIAVLTFAAILDWRLTAIVLAITPPAVTLLWWFGRRVRKATVRLLEGYGYMLVSLEESLQGLDVVKGYAREGYERRRMWKLERRMFKQHMRLALIEALSSPLIEVIGVIFASGGIVWLASRTFEGSIEPDRFLVMVVLLSAMLDPIRKVANVYNMVQRAGAASLRIFETLDQEEEPRQPAGQRLGTDRPPRVAFENVTFRYRPDAPPAVDNVSFTVEPGESVALVGPNGSGKSTLMRLLPRLLGPEAGTIRINDVPLAAYSLRDLRQHMAVVTQKPVVFARSARENISYGALDAPLEAVREAARRGHAAEFIEAWPQQYETVLGEGGATISGGQQQRIAIARAFLKPASLVIFDEATSQIDAESERKIHAALGELQAGRTTFLIAHRHTVMDMADRIIVMDAGRVVDCGTRDELLARCPLFAALYRSPVA